MTSTQSLRPQMEGDEPAARDDETGEVRRKPSPVPRKPEPDAVEATESAAENATDEQEESTAERSSRRPWVILVALVVALALALGSGLLWLADRAVEQERNAALRAAKDAAVALTSIHHSTADADIKRVVQAGTGEFGELFQENLKSYVKMVRDSQVASSGEATGAAISKFAEDSAEVLVAVQGEVKNASSEKPQTRQYRMRLKLVKEDEKWLVAKLDFVG